MDDASAKGSRWPPRIAFFTIAALVVGLAVALPSALRSVVETLVDPPEGEVFTDPNVRL
jgi:hypothetical protein